MEYVAGLSLIHTASAVDTAAVGGGGLEVAVVGLVELYLAIELVVGV